MNINKIIKLLLILFVLNINLFAGWDIKSSKNKSISDLFFINENIGWMVTGFEGSGTTYSNLIFKTIDGGETWFPLNIGYPNILYAVYFVDENVGWVAGYRGLILKTTDGGKNWFKQNSNVSSDIKDICFYNENIGWAIGGRNFIIHTTDGGENWIKQTTNSDQDLSTLFFLDDKNGWAGGNAGTILHTTDGGENWGLQNSGGPHWVSGIQFLNSDLGYAYGTYGGFYSTKDGGTNWNLDTVSVAFYARGMHFFNENSGIIVNYANEILRTTDGGSSWESETISFVRSNGSKVITNFAGLFFLDNSKGFIFCGNGPLLKTTDSGATWNQLAFINDFTHLSVVHAFSKDEAIVGGYYGIYKTKDGGLTWEQKIDRQDILSNSINAMKFNSNNYGVAVTGYYKIFRSSDGGDSWTYDSTEFPNGLKGVDIIGNTSFVCGTSYNNFRNGVIFRSQGGGSWQQVHEEEGCYLTDIDFPTESEGWAVGSKGTLLHSTDGGNTWVKVAVEGIDNLEYAELKDVEFINDKIGWISGLNYGQLLHTRDGGITWYILQIPQNSGLGRLSSIDFVDEMNGWVTGEDLGIWKTTDGGESWELSQFPGSIDISMSDSITGWAITQSQVSLTTDGGAGLLDIENAHAMLEHDFDLGVIEKGNWVLSSTNSNSTWKIGNLENKSFSTIDNNNVYSAIIESPTGDFDEKIITPAFDLDYSETVLEFYVGYDGSKLESASLNMEISRDNYPLWVYYTFLDDGLGWKWRRVRVNLMYYAGAKNIHVGWSYTGSNGSDVAIDGIKFLTATDRVLTDIYKPKCVEILTDYSLSQNYPNPFNPTTIIEFAIPEKSNVRLKVFNSIGEEVAELVNNEMVAGYHSVNFNASTLSSGIYFYRITAGNFTKTMKMMLLK